jgi:hypothetical protein
VKRQKPRWTYVDPRDGREYLVYDTSRRSAADRIGWLLQLPAVTVLIGIKRTARDGKAA